MKPTHSVIMPVLNGEKHILQALTSALVQLGPHDEVLIVDNGSTDRTVERVRALNDHRVRLLFQSKPGPAAARNTALDHVNGKYVSFLDHDDLWPEGRLAGLLAAIESAPSSDASFGRIRVQFDGEPDPDYVKLNGASSTHIILGTVLFRSEFLGRVGQFDEDLHFGEDSDFLLRAGALTPRYVEWDDVAYVYRRHTTNMTLDIAGRKRFFFIGLAKHLARKRQVPS